LGTGVAVPAELFPPTQSSFLRLSFSRLNELFPAKEYFPWLNRF
jgi:hypothetical protein